MADVVDEGLAVARAAGVHDAYPDSAAAFGDVVAVARLTAGNVCSMLADRRAGRETEIDFINGAIADLAERYGLSAPVNRLLTRLVRAARPL